MVFPRIFFVQVLMVGNGDALDEDGLGGGAGEGGGGGGEGEGGRGGGGLLYISPAQLKSAAPTSPSQFPSRFPLHVAADSRPDAEGRQSVSVADPSATLTWLMVSLLEGCAVQG